MVVDLPSNASRVSSFTWQVQKTPDLDFLSRIWAQNPAAAAGGLAFLTGVLVLTGTVARGSDAATDDALAPRSAGQPERVLKAAEFDRKCTAGDICPHGAIFSSTT